MGIGLRRVRRAAVVAALLVSVPLVISLKTAEPEDGRPTGPQKAVRSVAQEPTTRRGPAEIRLLGVNDLHGYLEKTKESAGAADLDASMDRYEAQRPARTIRVHAGDMVGASPLVSAHFHDEPTVLAMNRMGFDVGTLGNHEFDEGKEEMLRLIDGGQREDAGETSAPGFPGVDFPYVAANTLDPGTGRSVLPPSVVVERDGVRVGFIGVTTLETPEIILPSAAEEFRFADISDTVNEQAARLEDRGVRAIVVLAHSGALDTDLGGTADEIFAETKQMSDAVDAVFSGHTHNRLDRRISGKPVVQAEEYGTHLEVVDLSVDRASGEVRSAEARIVPVREGKVDPEVTRLVARYVGKVAPISDRVVGTASDKITPAATPAGESALGDFVADGQRDLAGTDFALVPTGGLRTSIAPGPVTYGELFTVQPSGRDLVRMELSGEQVRRALEMQYRSDGRHHKLAVSGLRFAHDPRRPLGNRVVSLTLPDGEPVLPARTYSVAVNGFLAAGGGDFGVFTEGKDRRTVGTDIGALARHAGDLPQPFGAPSPLEEPRVTLRR